MSKILIVEDDNDTAQACATLLRRAGHTIAVADGYQAALHAAEAVAPDIMLCDIGLPDGDGCDLLQTMQQRYKLAGIAVTGHIDQADRQRCLAAGFAEYLAKPCDHATLTAAIVRAGLFSARTPFVKTAPAKP